MPLCRENVQLCHIHIVKKLVALLKTLWCLTTTANHYVNTYERIWHLLLNKFYLVSKECLVITAMHQLQHLVRSTLQWYMEVRHERTALRAEINQLITQQVWFHTAYTIAFDSLHLIKCLTQVEETLACRFTEVAYIHASEHNFFTSFTRSLFCLCNKRSYSRVARVATCVWYCTVGAVIVAAVLHLEEIACTITART